MIRNELNIKYLSESRIIRYLHKESSENEKIIVEKLRSKEINWENYILLKAMFERSEFKEQDESSVQYNNDCKTFMQLAENYNPDSYFLAELEKLNKITAPKAGQIWLTKAIPQLGSYEFEPVALPKYVYILSNPQPYQLLDDLDYVQSLKDYYTFLVLPVSIYTEFATHEDYIIESGNNILSAEFMVETWLESNMLVCNLEKCVGELNTNQIDELLNVYFASNNMEFNKDIYDRAKKGKFHDKDYGDIYDFHRIEKENIEYLYEPVNKLDEFLPAEEWYVDLLNQPIYAQAAGDENVVPPSQQRIFAEHILFSDENFELKFVVLEQGQLFIRLKSIIENQQMLNCLISIKDKLSQEELQNIDNINLKRAIQYLHVNILLKNRLVEISFFVNGRFYFLKNIDLRKVSQREEDQNGNSK